MNDNKIKYKDDNTLINKLELFDELPSVLYIYDIQEWDNLDNLLKEKNYVQLEEKTYNWQINRIYVRHPYLSKNLIIEYIDENDYPFMLTSKENRLDVIKKMQEKWVPIKTITSTVYENNWEYISKWTNWDYHLENWCKRVELWCKSWEWYELCEWCQDHNHSEPSAYRDALKQWKEDLLQWANAYLHWHYRSCEPCSTVMEKAWVKKLFLSRELTKEYLNIEEL